MDEIIKFKKELKRKEYNLIRYSNSSSIHEKIINEKTNKIVNRL